MTLTAIIEDTLRSGDPTLIVSGPGAGKSAAVEEYCRRHEVELWLLDAPRIGDPAEVGGFVLPDNGRTRIAPPEGAIRLSEALSAGRPALLFVEELTAALPSVWAALLNVIQSRAVAGVEFKGAAVIATANPAAQAANGSPLADAIRGRFGVIRYTPTAADWRAWFDGAPDDALGPVGTRAWLGAIAAYCEHSRQSPRPGEWWNAPPLLDVPPPDHEDDGGFPSPRAWHGAAKRAAARVGADVSRAGEVADAVSCRVGADHALAFINWLKERDLPDPEEVLKDPAGAPIPERLDALQVAAAAVVAAAVSERRDSVARVRSALTYLERVPRDIAAIVLPPIGRFLVSHRQRAGRAAFPLPEWVVEISRAVATLREAGVV